jgi:hypothetical protein
MSTPSTARRLKRTAQRLEEKRGRNAGDWPLAAGGRRKSTPSSIRSRPITLEVTPGQRSDLRVATVLISAVRPDARWLATPPMTAIWWT